MKKYILGIGLGLMALIGSQSADALSFVKAPQGTFYENDTLEFEYRPVDIKLQALFIRTDEDKVFPLDVLAENFEKGAAKVVLPPNLPESNQARIEITAWDGQKFVTLKSEKNLIFKNRQNEIKRSFLQGWRRSGNSFNRVGVASAIKPVYEAKGIMEFSWIPTNVWPDSILIEEVSSSLSPKNWEVFDYEKHTDWVQKRRDKEANEEKTYDVIPGKIRFVLPKDLPTETSLAIKLVFEDPDDANVKDQVFVSRQVFVIKKEEETEKTVAELESLDALERPETTHYEGDIQKATRTGSINNRVLSRDVEQSKVRTPRRGIGRLVYRAKNPTTDPSKKNLFPRRNVHMYSRGKRRTFTPTVQGSVSSQDIKKPRKGYRRRSLYR